MEIIEIASLEYNPKDVYPFHIRMEDERKGQFSGKDVLTNVPETQLIDFIDYICNYIDENNNYPSYEKVRNELLPEFLLK